MNKYTVSNLIPHTNDMILIDEIVEYDKDSIITKAIVKDSIFCDNNGLPAYCMLEMMAQSLGAYKGLINQSSSNKLAFLVGSRELSFEIDFIKQGSIILISAISSMQDANGFGIWDCVAKIDDNIVAKAIISVYNPDEKTIKELKNA